MFSEVFCLRAECLLCAQTAVFGKNSCLNYAKSESHWAGATTRLSTDGARLVNVAGTALSHGMRDF